MCGFAGIIDLDGLPGDPAQRLIHLRTMCQQLARRGPDDEQFYDDGFLSLVFRRLSIIDLDSGRQPIWNEDHSVCVALFHAIGFRGNRPPVRRTRRRPDGRAQRHVCVSGVGYQKLKVKFYSTVKGGSIKRMRIGMIRRTFPEFRSKYLDQPGAIFSAQSLDACYRQITSSAGGFEEDLVALYECMAITVFADLCKTIPTIGAPPAVNPPSPLQAWH